MPRGLVLSMLAMLDRRIRWRMPATAKEVYLTFDDGPEPEVTPWVLDILADHGVKATFFCLGRNVQRHPELFKRLRNEGHAVGHHTWDHPDGWRTPVRAYYRNVLHGAEPIGGTLFRPPYGRLGIGRARTLGKRYQVVLWDVMGGDFKKGMSGEACARHVLDRIRPGSIVVLHDNLKSAGCLRLALPLILEGVKEKDYRLLKLDEKPITNP